MSFRLREATFASLGQGREGTRSRRNQGGSHPGERMRAGCRGVQTGKHFGDVPEVASAGLCEGLTVGRGAELRPHHPAAEPRQTPREQE